MEVKVTRLTDWELVANEARNTSWKPELGREPSHAWKMKALMCRHSPIEALMFRISFRGLPSWISVHFVRHKIGITHWVSSQRPDRSPDGKSRHDLPQDSLVNHDMVLNAQAIIAISKKRLCHKASPETTEAWRAVVNELKNIGETELAAFCQPECWWCGGYCPEMQPCGMCPPKPMPVIA